MKFLTGILREGVFYEAPAWEPATEEQEQDVSLADRFKGLSERIEAERRKPAEPDDAIALGESVALLAHLRLRHVVTLNGDKVSVVGPALDEQTCARIRALKPGLVRLLSSEQP